MQINDQPTWSFTINTKQEQYITDSQQLLHNPIYLSKPSRGRCTTISSCLLRYILKLHTICIQCNILIIIWV